MRVMPRFRVLLAELLIVLSVVGGILYYCTAMPGSSFRGPLSTPSPDDAALAERLRNHVVAVASREHNVDHFEALEQAALYIEQELTRDGYAIARQEFEADGHKVRNIEVTIAGPPVATLLGDIVVGAHYDSVFGAPGANDNGSGVAAVLEIAGALKAFKPPPGRTLRLVFWVNEEPPYFKTTTMGSWVHARALSEDGHRVDAALSLETLGYYSEEPRSQRYPFPFGKLYPDTGDFVAFVGDLGSRSLVRQAVKSFREHAEFPSEGVSAPGFIPGVEWSDHWAYAQFGAPAIMITDTAPFRYPYYHTRQDLPDKIDFDRLARVVAGMESVIEDLVNGP